MLIKKYNTYFKEDGKIYYYDENGVSSIVPNTAFGTLKDELISTSGELIDTIETTSGNLQELISHIGSPLTFSGLSSVAEINDITATNQGTVYTMSDSGTITGMGSHIDVEQSDEIAYAENQGWVIIGKDFLYSDYYRKNETSGAEQISTALGTINGYIETINSNVDTISSNVTTVSSNLNTISGNVNTLSSNFDIVSGHLNTVSSDLNTLSRTVDNINEYLVSVDESLDNINYDIDYLSASISSFSGGGGVKVVELDPTTEEPAEEDPSESILYLTDNEDSTYSQWIHTVSGWNKLKLNADDVEYEEMITPEDIEDTVATVNKLQKDIDTQLIVNFPISNITKEVDYADSTQYSTANGATVYFAFTIPINSQLKIIPINQEENQEENETEVTMLSIYARQTYTSKIILGLYEYDYNTSESDYIADTGAVQIYQSGRNEFPLVHINPNKKELDSGKLYYITLHIQPNRSANGLFLLATEGMSNVGSNVNFIPSMAIKSQDDGNHPIIDFTNPDVGLNVLDAGGVNYVYGPWSSSYSKAYDIPAFFVSIRNGIYEPPPPPPPKQVPFVDIGEYTTELVNIQNIIGRTCSNNETIILRQIEPLEDVDITDWTIIDENQTDDSKFGAFMVGANYSTIKDKNNADMTNSNSNVSVTNESIGGGLYTHTYHSSCGISLNKDTIYYISCHSINMQNYNPVAITQIVQYGTPENKTDILITSQQWYVGNPTRFNNVQAPYLKVKTSDGDEFVI